MGSELCIRDRCAIDNKRLIKKLGELPESLSNKVKENLTNILDLYCLLYTSDAADDLLCVDLGGRRIIKKQNTYTALM